MIYDGQLIPYPHSASFEYFRSNNKPIISGLFVEIAPLSAISFAFMKNALHASPFTWGNIGSINMGVFEEEDYTHALFFYSNLLWVTDIILAPNAYNFQYFPFNQSALSSPNIFSFFNNTQELYFIKEKLGQPRTFNVNNVTFWHYHIGSFQYAEPVSTMFVCTNNWQYFVIDWFKKGERMIYYDSCSPEFFIQPSPTDTVFLINKSLNTIRLYINSSNIIPVLIKETWHPNWKAFQDDQKLKVYRATPGFMMIFAKGEVTLKYTISDIQILSACISILSLLFLFVSFFSKPKHNQAEKHIN
ncbi:MAG: hypothetical protein QXT25_02655 [Candidatus Anstonellaceae archaeon]